MIEDQIAFVTVELAFAAIFYGMFFGTIFSLFSHIINFWDN